MNQVTEIKGERILWGIASVFTGMLASALTATPLGLPFLLLGIGLIFTFDWNDSISRPMMHDSENCCSSNSTRRRFHSYELVLQDEQGRIVARREINEWNG